MSKWRGHGQLCVSPFQDKESCVERFYPDPNGFVSSPASSFPAATNCLFLTVRRLQKISSNNYGTKDTMRCLFFGSCTQKILGSKTAQSVLQPD
jgi:hypothetical protein